MKLSEFVYEIVKKASDYGDLSMTYDAFLLGSMKDDEDYSKFLDKSFFQVNALLRRLVSLGKMPYKVHEYEATPAFNKTFALPDDCASPVAVFQYDDVYKTDYTNYPFRVVNRTLTVLGNLRSDRPLYVQYNILMPYFKSKDIAWIEEIADDNNSSLYIVGGNTYTDYDEAVRAAEEEQVDLAGLYNIPEDALMIGIDWCAGRMNEDTSLGHSQEVEAETRLNDLLGEPYLFSQRKCGGNLV